MKHVDFVAKAQKTGLFCGGELWIENRVESISPGRLTSRLVCEGKTHCKRGWHHPIGWGPRLNKMRELVEHQCQPRSASQMQIYRVSGYFGFLLPWPPCCDRLNPQTVSQCKAFLPEVASVRHFIPAKRKVINTYPNELIINKTVKTEILFTLPLIPGSS